MVREYKRVTDDTRSQLIKHIKEGKSIKQAAELAGINYENAKAINRIYKRETRVSMKKNRFRTRKGEDQNAMRRRRLEYAKLILKKEQLYAMEHEQTGKSPRTAKRQPSDKSMNSSGKDSNNTSAKHQKN